MARLLKQFGSRPPGAFLPHTECYPSRIGAAIIGPPESFARIPCEWIGETLPVPLEWTSVWSIIILRGRAAGWLPPILGEDQRGQEEQTGQEPFSTSKRGVPPGS